MRALAVVACLSTGCSFFIAGVPNKPPPPARCPGVVMGLDIAGAGIMLVPLAIAIADGLINGWPRDSAALGLVVVGVPMGIVGATYAGSAVYGFHQRSQCEELKAQEVAAFEETQRTPRQERVRNPVTGEAPLHCAITEPDVGACFFDNDACTKEVERGGGTCETRTSGWCFDAQHITASRADTACAASQVDCDARRTMFSNDRTFSVTTCGTYSVAAPRVLVAPPPAQ